MTEVQFEQLLLRLERIATALERLALLRAEPSSSGRAAARPPASPLPAAPEPAVAVEPAAEPVTLVPDSLRRFLESRGIRVRCVPPPAASDPVLDRLSLFLGQRYHALKDVLGWIKRTMQTGNSWHLRLAGKPQEAVGACCQFCHWLHQLAFLTEYRYRRAPQCLIEARTSTAPEAQNFFSGQWLERFIRQQVESVAASVSTAGVPLLANAQIILPNNDNFELDLLADFGGTIYWIEAKTGAYQQYIRKYSQMARMLGLGPARSFLVLADAPQAVCNDLSRMTGMTVCSAEEFHAAFLQSASQQQVPQQALP